jgi:hypothetical protein
MLILENGNFKERNRQLNHVMTSTKDFSKIGTKRIRIENVEEEKTESK